jgi:hypothetical protein
MTALATASQAPPTARASGVLVSSLPAWLASAGDMAGELAGVEVFGGKLGRVIRHLERERVDYYYPRERVVKCYNGSRQEWDRALIPRCFFVGQGEDGRDVIHDYAVRYMQWRVRFVVEPSDGAQKQLRKEVTDLCGLLYHDPSLQAWKGLRGGDKCIVSQGPFRGFVGYVERDGGRNTFWIRTTIFERSTELQVPVECLERL